MPIALSGKEWARIKSWTNSDREDPEVVRRRELVKYLDATSRHMTKSWPNSLENVNKRNEEQRQARIQIAEQANKTFYKRYLKRKKEEQARLMYSARDVVFKNKDAPKLLLSAVIATATHKERAEQVKFLNERRREDAENKRKEDDEIIRKAKEWHELLENKRKKRFEANKQHQRDILDQAHEISERNRIEYETELNLQKIDNIKANKEMDAIKRFEKNFKEEEKARIFRDMERAKKENADRKYEQEIRDKMDESLIEVLNKTRARVEARRKKTELDVKAEKLRVLEAISQKLESGDAARDAKENAMLDKAIKQKNDADEARRQADLEKNARFRREREEARKQFLKDEERRLHEFNTMRQWEIMNRFKNNELYEEFNKQLREEKARKIREYRQDILKLWKERDEREARERADTRYFYGELAERKLRDDDNKVLSHAARLLQECRRHCRPEHALRAATHEYCKLNRLYPMPELPAAMREHFPRYAPRDGSAPDPQYRDPPPPPPAPPDDMLVPETQPQQHADGDKRSGLQDTVKTAPLVKLTNKPSESDDYKRVGPANGLQRRNLQTSDDILPPIASTSCNNTNCHCDD